MPTFDGDKDTLAQVSRAPGCGPAVDALRAVIRADNYRAVAVQRAALGDRLRDLDGPEDETHEVLAAVMRALHAEGLDGPEVWIECDDHGPVQAELSSSVIIAGGIPRTASFATCPMEH